MKNFPSTLIKQENTRDNILGENIKTGLKNIANKVISNIFGSVSGTTSASELASGFSDGLDRRWLDNQLTEVDILSTSMLENSSNVLSPSVSSVRMWPNSPRGQNYSNQIRFEDPFIFSNDFFGAINNYRYVFNYTNKSIVDHGLEKDGSAEGKEAFAIMETAVAPSLFNPFNAVMVTGITENVPLVNENGDTANVKVEDIENYTDKESDDGPTLNKDQNIKLNTNLSTQNDVSDCSIRTLVKLSNEYKSELGLATYRYVDFMYCKDLGKIPNNRLITLRKFSGPIGDNIFKDANIHWLDDDKKKNKFYSSQPDIGRLVTWFDNEDNKLEDICKYNYHATWKEFTAEIDQRASEQKDDGMLDKLANLFSPQNNQLLDKGYTGHSSLLGWAAQKMHIPVLSNEGAVKDGYGWETLRNYDQHRIYEPPNRVWDTHKYEGRLMFNQDINLVFRYKMRSYDNINPKSAFLDLLGNIMVVTYRRGSFWGGENKIYGAQGNNSIYAKGHALIDKAFDELGGIWHAFAHGAESMDMILGWMGEMQKIISGFVEKAKDAIEDPSGTIRENMKNVETKDKKYKWTDALKGLMKTQLGRPALYAFNSLLSGEDVGPWHLTIGNPRNPIMSIGNLILMDSQVWHSGPLGLDDFPTELNVKVTLKHARGRDAVDIQKMYTKGRGAIYNPMNLTNFFEFRDSMNAYAFGDLATYKGDGEVLKKLLASV